MIPSVMEETVSGPVWIIEESTSSSQEGYILSGEEAKQYRREQQGITYNINGVLV